jgi:hypothetical protein
MRLRRWAGIVIFALPAPILGQTARYSGPIVDVHVHAEGGAPLDARVKELEAAGVVAEVVFGPDSALKEWLRRQPGRTIPSLNLPCLPDLHAQCFPHNTELPDLQWVRAEIKAGRLRAFGELVQQYAGMSPADPRLEPYFALAEEFDLPVGIHLGLAPPRTPELCCPAFRTYLGRPYLLEDVLARHPKLRVYIMHAGYPYAEETIAILHMYPNVYVDISAIAMQRGIPRGAFHAYLRRLTEAGFHSRVMYGSDYPGASERTIDSIDSASFLDTGEKTDIFCRNAVRFFRLTNVSCERRKAE